MQQYKTEEYRQDGSESHNKKATSKTRPNADHSNGDSNKVSISTNNDNSTNKQSVYVGDSSKRKHEKWEDN